MIGQVANRVRSLIQPRRKLSSGGHGFPQSCRVACEVGDVFGLAVAGPKISRRPSGEEEHI